MLAFPLLWWALPGLTDRGWSVARTAGVLVTGWLAWLVGSTGLVPHTPSLVWGAVCVLGLASLAAASADPRGMIRWLRSNARLIAVEDVVAYLVQALDLPDEGSRVSAGVSTLPWSRTAFGQSSASSP